MQRRARRDLEETGGKAMHEKKKKSVYVFTGRRRVADFKLLRLSRPAKPQPDEAKPKPKPGENLTQEEKQMKSVYVVMSLRRVDPDFKVLRINPHAQLGDGDGLFQDVTPIFAKNSPPDFNYIELFSIAALGPKIYFVGGRYKKTGYRHFDIVSRQVFAFNTHSNQWDAPPTQLNLGRVHSTVLTYNNKIYAFGYKTSRVFQLERFTIPDDEDEENENPESESPLETSFAPLNLSDFPDGVPDPKWVEVFDPDKLQWDFVPSNGKIPTILVNKIRTIIPAVHGDSAYFCLQGHTLYAYHFPTCSWNTLSAYPYDILDGPALYWSDVVVVFRSFLFFHHYGTIYATKFGKYLEPYDLLTIQDAKHDFGRPSFNPLVPHLPPSSFLVNTGNGVMCLVYKHPSSRELKFHKIELQVPSSDEIPSLHNPNYSGSYSEDFFLSTVLAV